MPKSFLVGLSLLSRQDASLWVLTCTTGSNFGNNKIKLRLLYLLLPLTHTQCCTVAGKKKILFRDVKGLSLKEARFRIYIFFFTLCPLLPHPRNHQCTQSVPCTLFVCSKSFLKPVQKFGPPGGLQTLFNLSSPHFLALSD